MIINLNKLILEKNKRAWTQGHLAEVCGLSLRTIQRIEKTGVASHDTIKALASVFEISIEELIYLESDKALKDSIPKPPLVNEKPTEGKGLAITGLVFVLIFIVLTTIFTFGSLVSSMVTVGQLYIFAYMISFITLLPGIIFLCVAIGIHKFNQVWSNRALFIAAVLFLVFNLKIGIFVFILAYVVLYKLLKEQEASAN